MLNDPHYLNAVVTAHRNDLADDLRRTRACGRACGREAVRWSDVAATWRAAARTTAGFLTTVVRI